jgi:hypothetical protein
MTFRKMPFCKSILLLISLSMIAALVACSSSSPTTTTTPPPAISVSIPSPLQNLAVNGTSSVSATVLNDSANKGVNWTVTCGSAGACGSFNPTSTLSGVSTIYTAPAAVPTGGTVTITATSVTDPTKSANLTVNITAAAAITVTFTTPPPASLAPLGTANIAVTVANDSANAGVTWSCTPATTCGSFTNVTAPSLTATYTAPATTGNVVITATSVSPPNATASATVTITTAASGTLNTGAIYIFSASGADNNGFYSVAGAFTVGANGTITGGEQDFIDVDPNTLLARPLSDSISGTASSYTKSSDGNLLITLTTCNGTDCTSTDTNVGVLGVETFSATLVSSSQALIVEFDNSATSRGSMDQQTGSPVQPSGGYAFYLSGEDAAGGGVITVLGGILNFDGSGNLTTTDSAFDINDASFSTGAFTDQLFSSGTVFGFDPFGRVQISLSPATGASTSGVAGINLIGYVVGPGHVRLVETGDAYGSVTGGSALGQTGTFTNSAISGSSYVIGTAGADNNFALQMAGVLTLTATPGSTTAGTVSGTLSYNDTTVQNAQGGTTFTGTYTLDTTNPGRITISNLTDGAGVFSFNLQLYLSGDGNAVEISVDLDDLIAGLGFQQTGAGTFTADSFAGSYALVIGQAVPVVVSGTLEEFENDGVGPVVADGVSALTGFIDFNNNVPPTPDVSITGNFAANASGVFTGTVSGISSTGLASDNFTYYLVDGTKAVAIETDTDQLTLGYFLLQQ